MIARCSSQFAALILTALTIMGGTCDDHHGTPGYGMLDTIPGSFQPGAHDLVAPPGLPLICKWMIAPDQEPAHWPGEAYEGKSLQEPINLILVDCHASSAEEAAGRFVRAAEETGYPSRWGHSSGYYGYVDGQLYGQLSELPYHAFSNRHFFLDNNHGRVFGPVPCEGCFLFIGSLSREKVAPFARVHHQYVSFTEARDDFSRRLDETGRYRLSSYVEMENAIALDPCFSTGDHDGRAALLVSIDSP